MTVADTWAVLHLVNDLLSCLDWIVVTLGYLYGWCFDSLCLCYVEYCVVAKDWQAIRFAFFVLLV